MPEKYPPVDWHTGETVHAAHAYHNTAIYISKHGDNPTQCCENEAGNFTQSKTHLPPSLPGCQEIHRNAEKRHHELCQDQVHQEKVEVCPQLESHHQAYYQFLQLMSFSLEVFLRFKMYLKVFQLLVQKPQQKKASVKTTTEKCNSRDLAKLGYYDASKM